MKISEINFENYNSLEELCLDIENRIELKTEEDKNRLRWQLFTRWHDEFGFTDEDEEWVRACCFDIDMFETAKEWGERGQELLESNSAYRTNRDSSTEQKDDYIKNSYKSTKNEIKKLKKVRGKTPTADEVKKITKIQHEKESEINAYLIKAERSLKRKDKDIQITAELLVKEIYINEGRSGIPYQEEELLQKADEYIENGGSWARISLRMTSEEFVKKTDAYIAKNQQKLTVWGLIGLTAFNFLLLLIRYLMCIVTLDRIVVSNNQYYILLSIIVSAVAWVYMTTQDYFNFHNRKWQMLILVIANDAATLLQLLYTVIWDKLVVNIFKISVNDLFTQDMVLSLARIVEVAGLAVGIVAVYNLVKPFLTADEVKEKVLSFKLKQVVDTRENKEFQYDFNQIKDLKTGKTIVVKEHDLYTHALLLGASGTGKTSSIFIPQIIENIRKKQKNLEMQQREVLKMVQKGFVEISKPFTRNKFGKQYFTVTSPEYQSQFDSIFETYKECGITVVAPNNSMNEDILNYTSGRGIWINNLDPTKKKATHPYERLVGMNPFYIPPRFADIKVGDDDAEEERNIYIAENANNFADALTAINEMNGSGDQYFTDVNTTVTSAVATVAMLNASINNTQVTIDDIYNCIVDFSMLTPIVNNIKHHFKIKYINKVEDNKKGNSNQHKNVALPGMEEQQKPMSDEEEKALQQKLYNQLTEEDRKNPYIQTIITVESRLQKGSKMDEHAEGLRNLIGKLLQDPRVKRVLVTNKDIIDFNEILADNAITVVNTALEFGKNTSTCFGQLFLLNFNSAVLRRPKNLRTPHFLYEDETARYLSDTIDTMVTLYRQYNVACMFALQSLDQTDKSPQLAYLKNTLLSAGTIITFGRASYADSKTISDLGGQERYNMVQHTKSYKSIFSEDASSSFSDRTTPDQKNYVDPQDVRYRDFQECVILTADEGNVLPARLAKASFVPKEILNNKEPAQIEQNNAWEEIWRNRYPVIEEVMPINAETIISSSASLDMAETLRTNSSQSLTILRDGAEKQAYASQTTVKKAATLGELLNTQRYHTKTLEESEIVGQVEQQLDWELDEEWGFSEEESEEDLFFDKDSLETGINATIISTDAVPDSEPAAEEELTAEEEDFEQQMQAYYEEKMKKVVRDFS